MYRMDIEVLELKRRLSLRKEKYKDGLNRLFRMFGIKNDKYLVLYDKISEKMVGLGIEYNRIRREMSEVDKEFDRLKKSILLKENIDLRKEIDKFDKDVKGRVVDELFNNEFIGSEEWDLLKNYIWNNRYRKVYSD